MDLNEKLELQYRKKEKGNKLFREGNFEDAGKNYSKALMTHNHMLKERLYET
jgi:hypothetical protein